MIQFFKNLKLYLQFRKALLKAECAGEGYIVANVAGKPWVFNRQGFKNLQKAGVFSKSLHWGDVKSKQVTKERLRSWIS